VNLDFQKRFLDAITNNVNDEALFTLMRPVAKLTSEKALAVYRDDYSARIIEALGSNYEATWLYLGDDDFFSLGREYIKKYPSHLKNLTYYGAEFPKFLQEQNQAEAFYIADFEKKFWQLFNSKDSVRKKYLPAELMAGNITFNFDSCFLLEAPLNINKLWQHRAAAAHELEDLDFSKEVQLILYKEEGRVAILELTKPTYELARLILKNNHLPQAIEAYCQLDLPELTPSDWQKLFTWLLHS